MAKKSGRYRLVRVFSKRMQRYGVYLSFSAEIADSVQFPHPIGIVIGDGVVVEDGVRIFQNVTLGGARIGDARDNNYPYIGKDSIIFAGAVIVGKIRIGQGSTIGANSVVFQDVPDFMTAVGAPARIVNKRRDDECTS